MCRRITYNDVVVNRVITNRPASNKEINEIIDSIENSKKTMGMLLKEAKEAYKLHNSDIDKLDKLLIKRNYLIHKYFKKHSFNFYSDKGKLEMLQYFCDFIDEAKQADEVLTKHYTLYTDRLGLTQEKVDALMEEMKKEEAQKDKT